MSAAAIITAILSGLSFVGAVGSGLMLVTLASGGAPGSVTRFWMISMFGLAGAGWLLGWAAWS